jgi:hypothetical protein
MSTVYHLLHLVSKFLFSPLYNDIPETAGLTTQMNFFDWYIESILKLIKY